MWTNSASRSDRPGNSTRSSKSRTTCRVAADTGKQPAIDMAKPVHAIRRGAQFHGAALPGGSTPGARRGTGLLSKQMRKGAPNPRMNPRSDRVIRVCSSSPRHRWTARITARFAVPWNPALRQGRCRYSIGTCSFGPVGQRSHYSVGRLAARTFRPAKSFDLDQCGGSRMAIVG